MGRYDAELTCEEKKALEEEKACALAECTDGLCVTHMMEAFFAPSHVNDREDVGRGNVEYLYKREQCDPSDNREVLCNCDGTGSSKCCCEEENTGCSDGGCPSAFYGFNYVALARAAEKVGSLEYVPYCVDWENLEAGAVLEWDPLKRPNNETCDPCAPEKVGAFVAKSAKEDTMETLCAIIECLCLPENEDKLNDLASLIWGTIASTYQGGDTLIESE